MDSKALQQEHEGRPLLHGPASNVVVVGKPLLEPVELEIGKEEAAPTRSGGASTGTIIPATAWRRERRREKRGRQRRADGTERERRERNEIDRERTRMPCASA